MSQAKVDHYKQKKLGHSQEEKKSKYKLYFQGTVVGLFALGMVGWFGYSIYLSAVGPVRSHSTVEAQAMDDYIQSLTGTEVEGN